MENNLLCLMSDSCQKGISCVIGFHGLSAFSFVIWMVQSRLLNCLLRLLSFNRSWKEIIQWLLSSVSFWKIHGLFYFDRLMKEALKGWGKGGRAYKWKDRRELSWLLLGLSGKWWVIILFFFITCGLKEEFANKACSWKTAISFYSHFRGTLCGNRIRI